MDTIRRKKILYLKIYWYTLSLREYYVPLTNTSEKRYNISSNGSRLTLDFTVLLKDKVISRVSFFKERIKTS